MKKRIETGIKAEKRDLKKRPRMKVHGAGLKKPTKHGGKAIIKRQKISN